LRFSPLLAAEVEVTSIWIVTFELDTYGWENKQKTRFLQHKKINPAHLVHPELIATWMQ